MSAEVVEIEVRIDTIRVEMSTNAPLVGPTPDIIVVLTLTLITIRLRLCPGSELDPDSTHTSQTLFLWVQNGDLDRRELKLSQGSLAEWLRRCV